jgi:PAS domain S-box-containing protein
MTKLKPTYDDLVARVALLEEQQQRLLQKNLQQVAATMAGAEALQRTLEKFSALAALVPGVIYQYRSYPDGRSCFPFASPGMNDIYEVTPEEVRQDATPVFGRLHPDDYDRIVASIQESARVLQPFHCEFRVVLPRQGLQWRLCDAMPVRMDDGGTLWHGIISDITERKQAEEALQESAERHRTILQTAMDGFWLADTNGRVLDVNESYCRMSGYAAQELRRMRISDLEAIDSAEDIASRMQRTILHGEASFESRHRRKDGSLFDVAVNVQYRPTEGGRFVAFVRDITASNRAAEALRASQERYRQLFELSSDALLLLSIDTGLVIEANSMASQLYGYDRDELLTRKSVDLSAEPEETQRRILEAQTLSDQVVSVPVRLHRKKDGTIFPVEITARHFVLDERPVLLVACRDISDRKKAEKHLAYVMTAVESTSEAIGITDGHGQHVYQNKSLSDLFEYATAEELEAAGGGRAAVHDPEVARSMFDAITHGRSWAGELEMVTKSGRVFPAYERADAIKDQEGNVIGLIGIISDITERKQAEQEKARLEGQLQQAQKMESVGRLAGGVAHDFNNMLAVILGHTAMALEVVDPAQPLHANLVEIRTAASRSAALTQQLLAFARKQTVAPRILDLNETVEGMLKMLQRLIGENVDLRWQPGAGLWRVRVDPTQIDQIVANLCVNARDAIANVGKLSIETGNCTLDDAYCAAHPAVVPGDYVRLAVSDDGCGMDKETQSHLFEPFFTTKATGKGTGLGLATVYGIVKQNNGFINVHSEPGSGTTFTIYLPRLSGEARQAGTKGSEGGALRGHETVLLVEDEPAILRLTKLLLERLGYSVLAACTPGEAIRLAREHPGEIHLLMTDVVMPEMNGRDLAKNLLRLYPSIRRLFMSGYTADVIASHGVLDEGVNFLQKPFTVEDLAAKLREALERK